MRFLRKKRIIRCALYYCRRRRRRRRRRHALAHPRRPRGSQSGREKRRHESFQVRAKELLGTDSHDIARLPVKMPNFTFCEGSKQAMTKFIIFMNLKMLNRNSAPGEFACI